MRLATVGMAEACTFAMIGAGPFLSHSIVQWPLLVGRDGLGQAAWKRGQAALQAFWPELPALIAR
jgi:hypothetical protein